MSTTEITIFAIGLILASALPLAGMLTETRTGMAWLYQAVFVVMAGTGVGWLLLCFYLVVIF